MSNLGHIFGKKVHLMGRDIRYFSWFKVS